MTNAEALAESNRLDAVIEARIAAGEIPPRPEGNEAWRVWYDTYVRCTTVTHAFYVRERGTKFCKACLARMTNAETSASVLAGSIPAFVETCDRLGIPRPVITQPWGALPEDAKDPNFGRSCGRCMQPVRAGERYAHACLGSLASLGVTNNNSPEMAHIVAPVVRKPRRPL